MFTRVVAWLACLLPFTALSAEDRNTKVLSDRRDVLEGGFWVYNDLPKGIGLARMSGKPLLVVLRCIP